MRVTTTLLAAILVTLTAAVQAGTLDRVRSEGTFRIGYRVDAPPFAFRDDRGAPSGYAVDLCRRVAVDVKSTLALDRFDVEYVPVTAENRFDMVEQGKVDILCGPTTVTLGRRQHVDFSLFTFVDGASVLFRADGPDSFEALEGLKVGVRAGTTTEEALRTTLAQLKVGAEVVAVGSHDDGIAALEAGTLAAYFADRSILVELLNASKAPEGLKLSSRYFTHEPYALAMARGDSDFRLLVDRTLSRLYGSGDIESIFVSAFGGLAAPTDVLRVMYLINSLQE